MKPRREVGLTVRLTKVTMGKIRYLATQLQMSQADLVTHLVDMEEARVTRQLRRQVEEERAFMESEL